ncbi:Triosephosphate isomerase [hydrothermal vent metagenome]|uniref:triose-phosphate isomerase n=1 Tax=hydrothermal vent metagenome TaxID=652676 RepID=A0A3B0WGH9_9ZZZZ
MRQVMVAGNWKMNGSSESVKELIAGIKQGMDSVTNTEVVVCPPAVYIPRVSGAANGSAIKVGSQNICDEDKGAFTGEISGNMLKDIGCEYAIIGHSERRALYGESDALVAKRFAAARRNSIKPIFCIGETLEERESGITNDVCARQIDAVLALEGVESLADCVIAYEPVWAIGTGKVATPEQAQEVHAFIRGKIAALNAEVAEGLQILYGGSMNPGNAKELIGQPDIDGGLIGGASLKADDFLAICQAGS